jgi:hypothetical protein
MKPIPSPSGYIITIDDERIKIYVEGVLDAAADRVQSTAV